MIIFFIVFWFIVVLSAYIVKSQRLSDLIVKWCICPVNRLESMQIINSIIFLPFTGSRVYPYLMNTPYKGCLLYTSSIGRKQLVRTSRQATDELSAGPSMKLNEVLSSLVEWTYIYHTYLENRILK